MPPFAAIFEKKTWKPASEPPKTTKGTWCDEVVAITNYGNVKLLSYYQGDEGGCWQRLSNFDCDEKVEWWIEQPF